IYAGWNWFSLNRKVVKYILWYLNENPKYLSRFKYTYCCDELFYHTILADKADDLSIITNNSLRFVEWNPKREYDTLPLILNENELDVVLNSNCFFCRKIHPSTSLKLMNEIDKKILQES
ncbi:beta-1,6-N-acetylglucosaminyltransferase, partial [Rosenbergiella metrosideri]|uniref:beta-1,6-N-acetylglucosaminyltransferase n=1 Tax=Rosenbergiella metrosideri TaxID=2921185 RepID=UPI001F4F7A82